jgi:uncharacterized membrane protein YhaH (DUF805 family)
MPYFLSFKGQMRPIAYALASISVFLSQHLLVVAILYTQGRPARPDWTLLLMPMQSLVQAYPASNLMLLLALAYLLAIAWALAALAFRRATNAGISEWIAALAVVPILQLPVIVGLSVMPPRGERAGRDEGPIANTKLQWPPVAQGVIAGVALTLLAVSMGALLFGTYGYGMFVASPFVIGALTAYLANRKQNIDSWDTAKLVSGALVLGAMALVVAALEGIACIVMAAPLALAMALIGGQLGRAIALRSRRPVRQTLSGVALLPLVFAVESILPPAVEFDTHTSINIHASPAAVWDALIVMQDINKPAAWPFRFGIAYPLSGEVIGEGVGALRHGKFTTGTALERVTEWQLERKLAFAVVSDVPAMRELSPYTHVHAPHVTGFFRTITTSFELNAGAGGVVELRERTTHELRLDPVFYWLPLTRWVVRLNNERVMAHIKQQAEASRL